MPIPEEDDEKTRIIRRPGTSRLSGASDEDPTGRPASASDEGEMTRLVGPPRRAATPGAAATQPAGDSEDPVVGWLVVHTGPGRGNARQLGYGQNSVGRERTERVSLDFGDASLSRTKHCFVIYEPRKREYILRPGDGSNLTYLNGGLVSEPAPVKAGDLIEIGHTTLRFVPLCGPDFDWQDQSSATAQT